VLFPPVSNKLIKSTNLINNQTGNIKIETIANYKNGRPRIYPVKKTVRKTFLRTVFYKQNISFLLLLRKRSNSK